MPTENIDLEVNRIKQNISDSYSELSTLGATIPATKSADNLATCVSSLQTSHIITQNGDNLVTNYGVNINYDGKNTIESLALSQRPGYSDFLVADNGNNTVKFSLGDLKHWINTPAPQVKGLFMAITNKNTAAISEDGINWDTTTLPVTLDAYAKIQTINYGFSIYNPGDGNIYVYDGTQWTTYTKPADINDKIRDGICINGITFWLNGSNLYKNDGITTSIVHSMSAFDLEYVQLDYSRATGAMLIRPINYNANYVISEDGITWIDKSLSSSLSWGNSFSMLYQNSIYTLPRGSGYFFYTDNLNSTLNIKRISTSAGHTLGGIVFAFNKWYSIGNISNVARIHSSSTIDGTWSQLVQLNANSLGSIASNNSDVIVCSDYSNLYYSTDGTNFTITTNPITTCRALAYSEVII